MRLFNRSEPEPIIKFKAQEHHKGIAAKPVKASELLPRWFRKLQPDLPSQEDGFPESTAKRCMPMFDSLSAGYIIPLPVAVHVKSYEPDQIRFWWRTDPGFTAVESHNQEQVGSLEAPGGVYKWINPWVIETPPGYSCLFTTPFNRNLPFECFTGIVDTDEYQNMINFPFVWKDFGFEGTLDAGDVPMIQVIPFKRQEWKHSVEFADKLESEEIHRRGRRVHAVRSQYRRENWHKKRW